MGKYTPSSLNNKYSDWHWRDSRFSRQVYLTDVDRIWVEIRKGKPVAAFDIKEPSAGTTWAETVVYDWLENKGLPVYIVSTSEGFKKFIVRSWSNEATRYFNQEQYINWVNNLGGGIF